MKNVLIVTGLAAILLMLAGLTATCKKTPAPFLTVDETPIAVDVEGGEFTIEVESNGKWFAVVENAEITDWLTLNDKTGSNNGIITVNIAENKDTLARHAVVKIMLDDLAKRVQFNQAAAEPQDPEVLCNCIMDTLKGEWSWWLTLRGGVVGGFEDPKFKSIVRILSQNEDESINYEVFVADTLFHKGSSLFQPEWSPSFPFLRVANIKLPYKDFNTYHTNYVVRFEIEMGRKNLIFCLPFIIAPHCYVYEKIERK